MKNLLLAVAFLSVLPAYAQQQTSPAPPAAQANVITGVVKSGATPLPGVNIAISDAAGRKVITSTETDGTFAATLPGAGHWTVRAEMAAFASISKEAVLDAEHATARIELQLTLASRAVVPEQRARQTIASQRGQEFQRLEVMQQANVGDNELMNGSSESPLPGMQALSVLGDSATESVTVSGSMGNTRDFARNFDELRERLQELNAVQMAGGPGGQGGPGGMSGAGEMGGLAGGPGGGPGGMGGPGMGGPGGGFGARGVRGFNINKPHGSFFYSMGNSALDAAPYSLNGGSSQKPEYSSNRFGASIGGPLPKSIDSAQKTSYFVNFTGTRATNPYDVFSTVPTLAERNGDFSSLPAPLVYPGIVNNRIVSINPAAQALLNYIPLPNQPEGAIQNYRYVTFQDNNTMTVSARLMHNFGTAQRTRRNGGRGGRNRNNINFGFSYSSSDSDLLRAFPTLAGSTSSKGLNINAGYSVSRGRFSNQLRLNFNQNKSETSNRFAGVENVAAAAGITGVSTNPIDWGVPRLTITNYSSLNDVSPSQRRDRVYQIMDTAFWRHSKHSIRFGGGYRRTLTSVHSDSTPNGAFTFTGFATGNAFADFLLGLPLQTSLQYSPYTNHFAANGYDFFVQDSWRISGNFTAELGLRYEYVSPYTEGNNRLANLSVNPGFTSATVVGPGQAGFPSSLIRPDRNNFAPRLGFAWKPMNRIVVRGGYGINYNNGQYRSIIQQLAAQPLVDGSGAIVQTNVSSTPGLFTLQNGFTNASSQLRNSYGIDPDYRLGYVQMWTLNVQYELNPTLLLNVAYTGSKGTALDMLRAPNRNADGTLRIAGVDPFLWETSQGSSIMHGGSVQLRKRMSHGMSVGARYTFSKAIDNASSIGGTGNIVAQNDLDLAAERGLSSFDRRHQFQGDYTYELPFGTGKKWLDNGGAIAKVLGDWTWSGNFSVQSGSPYTVRVAGAFTDVSSGVNGTLRADYTGAPIQSSNPRAGQWFNVAAFALPVAPCTVNGVATSCYHYGSAGRNTVIGPGGVSFNMSMGKNFPIRDMMAFEVRITANNVFNMVTYSAIDTNLPANGALSSSSFGQVTSVGSMRKVQLQARFRF